MIDELGTAFTEESVTKRYVFHIKSYDSHSELLQAIFIQLTETRSNLVVKALYYKPEGRGSKFDEVNGFFQFA
jgi:hypothetical protein